MSKAQNLYPAASNDYARACYLALLGQTDDALGALEDAVQSGHAQAGWMARDEDLAALRSSPRFTQARRRALENHEIRSAYAAYAGTDLFPPLDQPQTFPNTDSLESWRNAQVEQAQFYYRNGDPNDDLPALVDIWGTACAAILGDEAEPPSREERLYRWIVGCRTEGLAETGGDLQGLSDNFLATADRFLATAPSAEWAAEVNLEAAMVALGRTARLRSGRVPARADIELARPYLARIPDDHGKAADADGWNLWLDLVRADEPSPKLLERLRQFEAKHPWPMRELTCRRNLAPYSLQAHWPSNFQAEDLDGDLVRLPGSEDSGHWLLMDFWATWCPPCRGEFPHLRDAAAHFGSLGLDLVSISADDGENTSTAELRAFIQKNQLNWRHLYDGLGRKSPAIEAFRVTRYPTVLLIAPDGSLAAQGDELRGKKLHATLTRLLVPAESAPKPWTTLAPEPQPTKLPQAVTPGEFRWIASREATVNRVL